MEGYHPELVHTLRTIPDMDKIISKLKGMNSNSAVVIGGGFIGIELAENLHLRGIKTELVEFSDQVMMPFDKEMANIIHRELKTKGITLHLNDSVKLIKELPEKIIQVELVSGKIIKTGIIISAVGVRPESDLAKDAGLKLNSKEAIVVNEFMQTTNPHIYAVGDAIEVTQFIDGTDSLLPLAGPAAKQARIAANHIAGIHTNDGRIQGTAIVKIFDLTAASTGLNEKYLKKTKIPYQVLYLHPFDHVDYYPGAHQMTLKVIYNKENETLLGAQAIGESGVDKRIDVLATAIRGKMKITDLQELELCYAPPFGSSKDAINMAGFMADNIKNKLVKFLSPSEINKYPDALIIDVRTKGEYERGNIKGSQNIPLGELRKRLQEIPRDKTLIVHCGVGIRSYNAIRILASEGFQNIFNLSGGFKSYINEFQNNS